MSNTPWWSALIAPGATLIAFVLGVVVSWWSDHRKWAREDKVRETTQQREDELRYHKERLEAYATLLAQGETYMNTIAVRKEIVGDAAVKRARKEKITESLDGQLQAMIQTVQKVSLIATPRVAEAAGTLWQAVIDTEYDNDDNLKTYIEAEVEFQEAARQELGNDPKITLPTKRK